MSTETTSPVLKAIQAKVERDERQSAIRYDLARVYNWQRRPGMMYARRAPGLFARLLRWFR